jgi:uncharacterized membrane protein
MKIIKDLGSDGFWALITVAYIAIVLLSKIIKGESDYTETFGFIFYILILAAIAWIPYLIYKSGI